MAEVHWLTQPRRCRVFIPRDAKGAKCSHSKHPRVPTGAQRAQDVMLSLRIAFARGWVMSINRRTFLAAVPASLLAAPAISAASLVREKVDVVVIGAGLAGLNAAVNLEDLGASVMVLEAQSHIGGRLRTLRRNNRSYECGATTIGPEYGRIRALADRFNVPLVAPHRRGGMAFHINGVFGAAKDWTNSRANRTTGWERDVLPVQLEQNAINRFGKLPILDAWRDKSELKWDIPLDRFYRDCGLSDEAIRLIEITSNVETLASTSALFQMKELQSLGSWGAAGGQKNSVYEAGGADFHYIGGGSDRLPQAIAAGLKGGVRTNAPVVAVDMTQQGCTVTCVDGSIIRCQYVISAVPFTALSKIKITPTPTGPRAESINNSEYMGTTNFFFEVTRPYWEEDKADPGLITDSPIERVFANKGDSGEVEWLNVWVNGKTARAIDQMGLQSGVSFVMSELFRLRPSMQGAISFAGMHSWGANPYVTGNKHLFKPGQVSEFGSTISEPWLRMHFAGEHTRDVEPGMEAAAATGERAAFEILEKMGKA